MMKEIMPSLKSGPREYVVSLDVFYTDEQRCVSILRSSRSRHRGASSLDKHVRVTVLLRRGKQGRLIEVFQRRPRAVDIAYLQAKFVQAAHESRGIAAAFAQALRPQFEEERQPGIRREQQL